MGKGNKKNKKGQGNDKNKKSQGNVDNKKVQGNANDKKEQGESSTSINIDITMDLKRIQRLIYLTEKIPCYVAGDPELHFLKKYPLHFTFITEILTNVDNAEKFVELLKNANKDPNLPRRVTLLYVLAYALRNKSEGPVTHKLAEAVLEICKTDEEFFKFISIFTQMKDKDLENEEPHNKVTTSLSRIIRKYFENKSSIGYAKSVCRTKGYYGWQYKDLIKLSHYKSEITEKLLITEYVLFGLKGMKEPETEELKSIYKLLQNWSQIGKPETSVEKICELIEELKPDFKSIHPKHLKKEKVWAAIIPHLSAEEVMKLLPKLHRYKFLLPTGTSIVQDKVIEALTVAKVRCQNVNPLVTFVHLKNFEKGGKGIDPKLREYLTEKKLTIKTSPPVPANNEIVKMLHKCIHNADAKSLGLHKRILFVIDVTDTETVCFKQRNILCVEAQVALAMYYAKTEKHFEVAVVDGENISTLELDKSSYDKNLAYLKSMKSSPPNFSTVFNWALENEKKYDIFLFVMQSAKSLTLKDSRTGLKDGFKKYQTKNPELAPKLVLNCLALHHLAAFGETMNALSIAGFCPEIPKVIRAFVKGNIHSLNAPRPKKKE